MAIEISESPLQIFQFVNAKSSQVIAVKDGSTAEDARLVMMDDKGTLNQYWTARVFNREMLVGNAKSFLYISVQGGNREPGVPIVQSAAGSPGAKWEKEPEGDALRIKNANSNLYMSVDEAGALVQQPRSESENQRWIRRPVKTIRVSVGATINGEPTVYCNPLVTRVPRDERAVLLNFVLDAEFRSDWMFPEETVNDCSHGITIANGQGSEFIEHRRTDPHRVVMIDRNSDEKNYAYMVTLVGSKGRPIWSDDPSIRNRSDG